MNKRKKGSVEIIALCVMMLILIIIFISIYLLYLQINTYVYPIKEDIYYIVQNSFLSLSKEELAYSNYFVDEELMFKKVDTILKLNHKEAELKSLKYNVDNNYVDVEIVINIKPVIMYKKIGNIKLKLNDRVKIKLMEVG